MKEIIIVRVTKNGDGYFFDYKKTRVLIKKVEFGKLMYIGACFSEKQDKSHYSKPNQCLNSVVQEFISIIDERS